ncbi:hypothetical protein SUDANB171_01900 [Streptomyces sp. enrichment culture]|uniref:hypothetical protein n=1 Tax=Streptomyces sp. enrichment culture TaxID=1795815 RepID=UPI003F5547D9
MPHRTTPGERGVQLLLAGWLAVTVLSQHPQRSFDALRRYDKVGAIPNWRFFAPFPIQHDYVLLYRVAGDDGRVTPWRRAMERQKRSWSSVVWSPGRRGEKSVLAVCAELVTDLLAGGQEAVRDGVPDRMLRAFVRQAALMDPETPADGRRCQFLICESGGYETAIAPKFLHASPFFALRPEAE